MKGRMTSGTPRGTNRPEPAKAVAHQPDRDHEQDDNTARAAVTMTWLVT
jgi:hypothetical protein